MAKLQTITLPKSHSILLLGPSKVGKTTLAAHLFEKPHTVFISFDEDGLSSIRPIDAFIIDRARPFEDFIDTLTEIKKLEGSKTTIVVDDVTRMGYMLFRNEKPTKGGNVLPQYGKAIDKMRQIVEKLKWDFNEFNKIYCSLDMYVADKEADGEDSVVFTYPNVIGRYTFAQELPGLMDHIFYLLPPKQTTKLEKQNGKIIKHITTERRILTAPSGVLMAGNRINIAGQEPILELTEEVNIGENLENIENLRKKLKGELNENSI